MAEATETTRTSGKGVEALLTRKVGPLPVWAYGAGAAVLLLLLLRKKATPAAPVDNSQQPPFVGDSGGGVTGSYGGVAEIPGTNTTTYVCADGTQVSSASQCPPPVIPAPPAPTPVPVPMGSGLSGGYNPPANQGVPTYWQNGQFYGNLSSPYGFYNVGGVIMTVPGSARFTGQQPAYGYNPYSLAANPWQQTSPGEYQAYLQQTGLAGKGILSQAEAQLLFNRFGIH